MWLVKSTTRGKLFLEWGSFDGKGLDFGADPWMFIVGIPFG